MSETITMTKEELAEVIRVAKSEARQKKTYSDFFRNKETTTAKMFKSLSETARHVETNCSETLVAMRKELNVADTEFITVKQFNEVVAKALLKYYE